MKHLSPETTYWLSLMAITLGAFGIGYLIGLVRARQLSYDLGFEDGADALREALVKVDGMSREELPQQILHFDSLEAPPTWITDDEPSSDSSLVPHPSSLTTGGAQ